MPGVYGPTGFGAFAGWMPFLSAAGEANTAKSNSNATRITLRIPDLLIRRAESSLLGLPLQIRNAFLHPRRFGRTLQEMIEELLHADGVIFLINPLANTMLLAVVVEQIHLF